MDELNLKVTPQEFSLVWAALGELQAKFSFAVMLKLQQQVQAQEAASDPNRKE